VGGVFIAMVVASLIVSIPVALVRRDWGSAFLAIIQLALGRWLFARSMERVFSRWRQGWRWLRGWVERHRAHA
jgi:hypothetical protein